jgi:cell division protein FtsB
MGNISFPFFMKKKAKRLLKWFYKDSDKGEQNVASCSNLYELIERLQYRLENMENEHMHLVCEIGKLQSKLDMLESELSNED